MCDTKIINSEFKVMQSGIYIWYDDPADIPPDYALCDGTNGTPDLRNKRDTGVYIMKL